MEEELDVASIIEWFFEHYDDPANLLPYESKEGGYIPIFGPLRETEEILYEEFDGVYDDAMIDAAAREIGEYEMWSPIPGDNWHDDFYDAALFGASPTEQAHAHVVEAFGEIRTKLNDSLSDDMMRLLFSRIYAVTEAFLESYLVGHVHENISTVIEDIDNHPELKKIDVPIVQVFKVVKSGIENPLEAILKQTIATMYKEKVWHRFDEVRKIYGRYDIPITFGALKESKHIRDDIIHRDGRKKEDVTKRHTITAELIDGVLGDAERVVERIVILGKKEVGENPDF